MLALLADGVIMSDKRRKENTYNHVSRVDRLTLEVRRYEFLAETAVHND